MTARTPAPGTIVESKYRLAERIGGGGMGDVYRAEHSVTGRALAIKFLHPELSDNADLATRFFQEAQAVNRIRHPNIVDVLDAGVGELGPYIVMEYLEGESVGSALGRLGRFDTDGAVGTAIPVLEALDAAHRVGIIHRDLKPENVFIAYDPQKGGAVVRLLDFGIAKMLDGTGTMPRTRTGVVFGTPDYLSPEQATGEVQLDGRSDLFAVGVLLYELLTGTRPFRAPTAVATAFRVVHAEVPNLAATGVYVDPRLEAVVQKLLQKDPSRRFPTAGDVVKELNMLLPDPQRRVAALGRIINVARRAAMAGAQSGDRNKNDTAASSSRRPPPRDDNDTPVGNPALGVAAARPPAPPQVSIPRLDPLPRVDKRPSDPTLTSRGIEPRRRPATVDPPRAVPFEPSPSGREQRGLRPDPSFDDAPAHRDDRGLRPKPFDDASSGRDDRGLRPKSFDDASSGRDDRGLRPKPVSARRLMVRPFPERFAGRFHVRGPVLRSVDRAIVDMYGQRERDEVVKHMPAKYAEDFVQGSINAMVRYDLEALDAYMELTTELLLHDVARWHEMGRLAVGGELFNVVRSLLRPTPDLGSLVRRGALIWAQLFSFGAWRAGQSPSGRALLQVAEFEPAASCLRHWVAGMLEETARRAIGAEVKVSITGGEMGFTPDLTCELV